MHAMLARADGPNPSSTTPPEAPIEFAPTSEQALVSDMLRRFFRGRADEAGIGRAPVSREHWRELADLGVGALLLPEHAGGLGGSPRDAALVAEELGRALAITPLAEGLAGAANLIARSGDTLLIEQWVHPALAGATTLALANGAVQADGEGMLSGSIPFVRWAPVADGIVVVAGDEAFVVSARSAGVQIEAAQLIDGTPVATIRLDGARADRLVLPTGAVAASLAIAQLCYVAEMVGAMSLLNEETVEYVKQRKQFGVAIASFQVVQHKLARMFVLLEQARSSLLRASLCPLDHPAFVGLVTGAKAYVADAALRLAEEAVQLHGGIGVTDELVVGRGLRRITVLARLFGTAEDARAKLAR